jgi:hypothetical protein
MYLVFDGTGRCSRPPLGRAPHNLRESGWVFSELAIEAPNPWKIVGALELVDYETGLFIGYIAAALMGLAVQESFPVRPTVGEQADLRRNATMHNVCRLAWISTTETTAISWNALRCVNRAT